jgi:lipoyl(octanoyl) transferase
VIRAPSGEQSADSLVIAHGGHATLRTDDEEPGLFHKASATGQCHWAEPALRLPEKMVRLRGLEPPHRFQCYHLKVVRLPIPPQPHCQSLWHVPQSRKRRRLRDEDASGNRGLARTQAADWQAGPASGIAFLARRIGRRSRLRRAAATTFRFPCYASQPASVIRIRSSSVTFLTRHRPVAWAVSDHLVAYPEAMAAMAARAHAIRHQNAGELVWLLEHPALYTAGTSAKPPDLKDPRGFPVFESGRGGQYTYHGPGQRIVYLMLDLKARGGDVRGLIENLEAWIIDTLAAFNVAGEVRPGRVGVWVTRPGSAPAQDDKIAAMGLRVSHGVTSHGISLNVDPDLSHYGGIVPCGIADHGVTSLAALGLPVTLADADVALRRCFEQRFGPVIATTPPTLQSANGPDSS